MYLSPVVGGITPQGFAFVQKCIDTIESRGELMLAVVVYFKVVRTLAFLGGFMGIHLVNATEEVSAHAHTGHVLSCQSAAKVNQTLAQYIYISPLTGIEMSLPSERLQAINLDIALKSSSAATSGYRTAVARRNSQTSYEFSVQPCHCPS